MDTTTQKTPPMHAFIMLEDVIEHMERKYKDERVRGVHLKMEADGSRMFLPAPCLTITKCPYFILVKTADEQIYAVMGSRKAIASIMPDDDIDDFDLVDNDEEIMFQL